MGSDASTASPSPWKIMYSAKTARSEFHSGTPTENAAGHPRAGAKTSRKPRLMKILARTRYLGHSHNQSHGHCRLRGEVFPGLSALRPCHHELPFRPPHDQLSDSKARSSADEYVAVIACARNRPETRFGPEAGGPPGRALLATFEPSRPTTSPQAQPVWTPDHPKVCLKRRVVCRRT
jgi:hypothetical protein